MTEDYSVIACTRCMKPISRVENYNREQPFSCPSCGALTRVDAFPALIRPMAAPAADPLLAADQAGCFYHPEKRAVVPCDMCGRFLCALCDIDMEGRHICFSCLETGKSKKKIDGLENRRTLYDGISMALVIWPLLIFYFTLITAPIAVFMSVRYWKSPLSIVPRTRIRFVAAFLIGLLQIGGWGFFFYNIIYM